MKIIVLQGVPASGKSTWAREFIKDKRDWIIVSKDSFREGKGEYWVVEHEEYIKKLEKEAVRLALDCQLNVIIDGTNFNPDTLECWEELSRLYNADLEIKKFTVSFEESLKRDTERGLQGGRAVGKKSIRYFFDKYNLYNSPTE